jgi:hypothetical protein
MRGERGGGGGERERERERERKREKERGLGSVGGGRRKEEEGVCMQIGVSSAKASSPTKSPKIKKKSHIILVVISFCPNSLKISYRFRILIDIFQ